MKQINTSDVDRVTALLHGDICCVGVHVGVCGEIYLLIDMYVQNEIKEA